MTSASKGGAGRRPRREARRLGAEKAPGARPGLFVVFEGVEGAGKSTQAGLLAQWLAELGIPHRLGREPGSTPIGEAIREVLLGSRGTGMSAETELLLMLAARAAFVRELVRPALEAGTIMIADRFELSTLAYQGAARGLGVEKVQLLNAFATAGVHPGVTIVLDIPVAQGRDRNREGGKVRDRIEAEGAGFHRSVEGAYRSLARDYPGAVLLDASPPAEEVHREVRDLLAARFPEHIPPRGG